jgi:hypothetical protein
LIGAAVVLVIVIAVAASSGGDNEEASVTEASRGEAAESAPTLPRVTSTTARRPPEFDVGDTVVFTNDAKLTIYGYEQGVPPTNQYFEPEPGFEFAVLDVETCAGPSETASYNALAWKAQGADNRVYTNAFSSARDPQFGSGDLPAGAGCIRGFVTIEVPVGQRPTYLLHDYPGWELTRWVVPIA